METHPSKLRIRSHYSLRKLEYFEAVAVNQECNQKSEDTQNAFVRIQQSSCICLPLYFDVVPETGLEGFREGR